MARKKKSKNSSIGYSGSVTVKVMHGNKTVRQVTTKNSGTLRLFKYIAKASGVIFFFSINSFNLFWKFIVLYIPFVKNIIRQLVGKYLTKRQQVVIIIP